MNGWQRMELVAFVIWALVVPILAWNDIHDQWSRVYQSRLSGCRASYDAAYKDKAEAYKRCFDEAADKFMANRTAQRASSGGHSGRSSCLRSSPRLFSCGA